MREKTFEIEKAFLSPFATKSIDTLGRSKYEKPCEMRTDFQRDRDRIIHSKSFRRLKNKTQVFFSPEGDNYRTRLTHTLDVSQIARSIARALSLNEDLTEAIALGHDLGHTPFGHAGERTLNNLSNGNFSHNEQSLRVVEVLENNGEGLNLTKEVKDGIVNHKMSLVSMTLEGQAVSISDWIAYINHDIDDAIRGGLLSEKSLPEKCIKLLGKTSRERINTMIYSIYHESKDKNQVMMESDIFEATKELRQFMFDKVYFNETALKEEEKANRMISAMYAYYKENVDKLPPFYKGLLKEYDVQRVLCDYISSMSDKYAVYTFENLFIPKSWGL